MKREVITPVKSTRAASLMERDKSSSQIAVTTRELGRMEGLMGLVFLAHQTEEGLKANCRMVDGMAEPQTIIDSLLPTSI